LVTTTTVWVRVWFTRLLAKLKEVPLNEAVVIGGGGGAIVRDEEALCVSVPEVPVRAMLAVPATAVEDALMLICMSEPGITERLIGVAVTPAGSEPSVTATVSLKPFTGETPTVNVCATPPGTTVMLAGATSREKSGGVGGSGEATDRDAEALCVSVPEVPVRATLAVPATAAEEAVMLICMSEPGVIERVIGVAVTPAGSEPTVTATLPLKPFSGETPTVNVCAAPPGTTVMLAGATSREKSDMLPPLLLPPPPHPTRAAEEASAAQSSTEDGLIAKRFPIEGYSGALPFLTGRLESFNFALCSCITPPY
jgi:hypothetical protein